MKLIFIISVGALFLLLTSSVEAATLGGIEPSIEKLNALETRQESLKGCSMSSLDKCYGTVPPDGSVPNDLLEEIGHISDAQTCQRFCNELYNGTCQWFMFDKTTEDCKLFSSPLNDLWNDCREVGYAREPDHELCDEMFPSDSSNGCYNFREDYCRYEFSLLENLEEIDSLSECQLACQYINNCSYFVYDSPSKICKLNTQLSQKTCDIIHGTPQPDLNTCISGGRIDWASNSGQPVTATERPAPTSTTTITTTTPTTTTTTTTTTLTTTTSTPNTTTSTPTATNTGCILADINYSRGDISGLNPVRGKLETKEMCQKRCQDTSECFFFTWVGDEYPGSSNHGDCYLKDGNIKGTDDIVGLHSGPKFCSPGLMNAGKDCWSDCNGQQGACDWCGSNGMCCEKGYSDTSNGCNGNFGGSGYHACVLPPEQ